MPRVRSVIQILIAVALLTACAPAVPVPTAVPPTVTADPTNTIAPTATLAPSLTPIPTETPTPVPTQEDFSDLHPELTIEAALNNPESILSREDLPKAVRKALAEAKPYPEGTEPAKYIIVETPTGMVNVEYIKNSYTKNLDKIPSRIEAVYKFKDIRGINGVLMIVSYLTPDGIKVITYNFDPTEGNPRLKLVDQHIIITPVYSEPTSEKNAEVTKKYPDEDLQINQLKSKHYLEVRKALEDLVAFGKISDDLWKTPLKPSTDFKTTRSDDAGSN